MEFFRHCPGCGRRFHIKLESKKLAGRVEGRSTERHQITNIATGIQYTGAPPVLVVQEGTPVVIDIEEFQYNYRCGHCGHQWSEEHLKEHKEH